MTPSTLQLAMRTATGLLLLGLAASCGAPEISIARLEDERRAESKELVDRLQRGSVGQQVRAALAMGRIQSEAYAGPLAEAARSGELQVRLAALFALGQLGLAVGGTVPEEAVAAALAALRDPEPKVVGRAVEALGKLADPRVPAAIVPYLRHAEPELRAAAALALFRCRFAPQWRGEAGQPPALPPDAVEALLELMDDENPAVRRTAVYAFSRFGQEGAARELAALVGVPDELTRLFAIRAIGNSQDPTVAGALIPALEDPSAPVRTEAVEALASLERLEDAASIPERDESFHVRAALARGLAEATSGASLEALERLAADPSTTVRVAAVDGLARRVGARLRPRLDRWLEDPDWRIRQAAAAAAGHLGADGDELRVRAMQDADTRVQAAALSGLRAAGGGDELILEALRSPDLAVRGTAVSLIAERDHPDKPARLRSAYESSAGVEWIEIRESVIGALADLAEAEELLRRVAGEDPASSVRGKARAALAARGVRIAEAPGPEPETSPYLDVRFDRDPVVLLETTKGEIEIRCHARAAPIHVASFVQRVREGFYDGLIWHRVVSNFVIQGGDPRGDGWGSGGFTLRDEINTWRYGRGAVGMPKAGKDTGGCQIFITHIPTPHLDGNYTVFGQVTSGMEVVDAIEVGDAILGARVR